LSKSRLYEMICVEKMAVLHAITFEHTELIKKPTGEVFSTFDVNGPKIQFKYTYLYLVLHV
jgi:hypothetical protein